LHFILLTLKLSIVVHLTIIVTIVTTSRNHITMSRSPLAKLDVNVKDVARATRSCSRLKDENASPAPTSVASSRISASSSFSSTPGSIGGMMTRNRSGSHIDPPPSSLLSTTSSSPSKKQSTKRKIKKKMKKVKIGRWEKWEQIKFLEGLRLYGRGHWKKIADTIPTRYVVAKSVKMIIPVFP
jgi:hypothetical protein